MDRRHIAITTDQREDKVTFACELTNDRQIDRGLKPYLERSGVRFEDHNPDLLGSQMFSVAYSSGYSVVYLADLLKAYYVSWGKIPSVLSIGDIIS